MQYLIKDKESFEKKKAQLIQDGIQNLHIITDFDRTLTKGYVEGQKMATTIAQVRNGKYLTKDYPEKAHALFDEYHPFEINPDLDFELKKQKMQEWWEKHLALKVASGMSMDIIHDIIKKKRIVPREKLKPFLTQCSDANIPFLIFSAGLGDIIVEFLNDQNLLKKNIHVIANFYKFNEQGKAIGYQSNIVHVFNKNEGQVKKHQYYGQVKEKKNVILLGDGFGDTKMAEGLDHNVVLKIGFYNDPDEKNLEKYQEVYDVVIPNDGPLDFPINLLQQIINQS